MSYIDYIKQYHELLDNTKAFYKEDLETFEYIIWYAHIA